MREPRPAWVAGVFSGSLLLLLVMVWWLATEEPRTKPPLGVPGGDESSVSVWN